MKFIIRKFNNILFIGKSDLKYLLFYYLNLIEKFKTKKTNFILNKYNLVYSRLIILFL